MENEHPFDRDEPTYTSSRYMYVNAAAMATGDNDFILKVETNLPDGLGEELNLIISPRMAKQLREALDNGIESYENLVGEIYMGSKILDDYHEESSTETDE